MHSSTIGTYDANSFRLLAKVFTRPVFASLARSGDYAPLGFLEGREISFSDRSNILTLSHWFDSMWHKLSMSYRNEYVYKNELATRLIFKRHSPKTAGFQLELGVGRSIVDVAIANGTSTAYEIKTEFDTSKRLKSQTSDYLKVFDKVYVVTHPAHVERYLRDLDPRVGLIVLSKETSLTPYREAINNEKNVDARAIFRCLRRNEYLHAINMLFGETPDLPNGLIAHYCEGLFSSLPPEVAHAIFVSALRKRTTDIGTVGYINQLPMSLRALGYATPLSGKQRNTILELLARPIPCSSNNLSKR